jgi:vitamin B12 transporter
MKMNPVRSGRRRSSAAVLLLAGVLASAGSATPLTAQEATDTVRLRDIVVTATRLPTPRDAVPAAVTVITGDELRLRGIRLISDALRTVPGAALAQSGSAGGITSLFLRGGESDYVMVLVDGVQVNEPGGAFDFAHLSTDNVERIEIVRGPASVLYGTDAVAGVVQIFTREGSGPLRVDASVEAGRGPQLGTGVGGAPVTRNHGVMAFDASARGMNGPIRYSFGAARYASDGVRVVNNEYENRSLNGRLAWRTTTSDAAVTARWMDNRYHYPTDGAGRIADLNQFSTGRSLALGFDSGHHLTSRVETRLLLGLHRNRTGFEDRPDSPADTLGAFAADSENRGWRRSADVRANVRLPRSSIVTLGAAAAAQLGSTFYESRSQWGPYTSETEDDRSSRALYAQVVTSPLTPLTLTLGGRAEDSRTFGRFDTWRAGANYRLLPGTTVRIAAGTAFKEPTFYENFSQGFVTGNPELLPERSRSGEVGLNQQLGGRGTLSMTAFRQRFSDMIQYDSRPRAQRPGDANYFNLAGVSADGLEAELTARVHEGVELVGGYAWLHTEVTDAGVGADRALLPGERLLRRPEHTAHFGVRGSVSARVSGAITARYVGERDDLDFSENWQGTRVMLDAFATVDASARIGLFPGMAMTVRADNLLDRRYEEIRNFPIRGRTLFLGVTTR